MDVLWSSMGFYLVVFTLQYHVSGRVVATDNVLSLSTQRFMPASLSYSSELHDPML